MDNTADWASAQIKENIEKHLNVCGSKAECTGPDCGAEIWWFKTKNGKNIPLDPDLRPHWSTCPNAKDFHK